MKVFGWILGVIVGLFVLMLVIGANISPEKARAYAAEDNAEAMCNQMMSDAALGSERRMTREMCDRLKAEMARRVREAGTGSAAPGQQVYLPLSTTDQARSICANSVEQDKADYETKMAQSNFKAAADGLRACARLLEDPYLQNMVSEADKKATQSKRARHSPGGQ